MATILIRTIIIYLVFIFSIRLLGKRQVGELELSELVITFMLSELATLPIQNPSIPLTYVLIPLVVLISGEIIFSFLITKSNFIKKIMLGNPSYIIKKGSLDQKELSKLRMGVSELLYELRLKDVGDISTVDYAILEQNGKLSVFEKNKSTISHALIVDGAVIKSNLELLNQNEEWLNNYLRCHNLKQDDIFLLTSSDDLTINIIMKETK